jgi:hypothetical protein
MIAVIIKKKVCRKKGFSIIILKNSPITNNFLISWFSSNSINKSPHDNEVGDG